MTVVGGTCSSCRTGIAATSGRDQLCAEGAFDASERSTGELGVIGVPGASPESGGCKHQSSSHPASGRAAGIGQRQPHEQRQRGIRARALRQVSARPPVSDVLFARLAPGGEAHPGGT